MKKKRINYRIGSLLLAVLLTFTSVDLSVFAAEDEPRIEIGGETAQEKTGETIEAGTVAEEAAEAMPDEVQREAAGTEEIMPDGEQSADAGTAEAIPDAGQGTDAGTAEAMPDDGQGADTSVSEEPTAEEIPEDVFPYDEESADAGVSEGPLATGYLHFAEDDCVAIVERDGGASPDGASSLPESYKTSTLPTLRDQNPYGSCWAFTSMALAEISRMKAGVSEQDYSELALCYFSYNTVEDPLGGTAGDSNECKGSTFMDRGGNLNFSGAVLANWVGAIDESLAPYKNADESLSTPLPDNLAYDDSAHLTHYYKADIKNDRESVKQLIYDQGAVGVSMYAFTEAKNTAYNATYNSYYVNQNTYISNHAVTIVGWDDTFPKDHFNNTAPGDGAWLVRNSWWSDSIKEESYFGYFWLSYYDAGLSADAHAFAFADADNYQHNYQYDGAMQSASMSDFGAVEGANVFTAKACDLGEQVRAASFLTESANVKYTVKVYTGLADANDPTSGVLWDTVTGTTTYPGYYTVPFSQTVRVDSGDTFSVVVTLEKAGSIVNLGTEYTMTASTWYQSTAKAEAGQSFMKSGDSWYDFGAANNYNLRIKAFTDDLDAEAASSPSINIAGGGEITYGETAKFRALIYPRTEAEGKTVTWTSSDTDIASVDDNGKVTAHEVGEITLTATCGDMTATKTITCYPHAPGNVSFMMDMEDNVTLFWDPVDEADYYIVVKPDGTLSDKIYYAGVGDCFFEDDSLKGNTVLPAATYEIYCYREYKTFVKCKSSNITIYLDNPCTIIYEVGDGKNHPDNPDVYSYFDSITLRDATPPTGYSFAGWYTDAAYTKRITAVIGSELSGILRLYARYSPNTYTLRYNANYGSSNKATYSQTLYYDTEAKIYAISDLFRTKDGCSFASWNTKKDGTGDNYYEGQSVARLSAEDGGYFDLYALWTSGGYTVTFDAGGGTCAVKSKTVAGGGAYGELPIPTRDGYRFSGWYTLPEGGDAVEADTKVSVMGDHTLYAHWGEPGIFIMTFDPCGGIVSPKYKTIRLNSPYGELPVPEKDGYVFEGWFLSQKYSETERITETVVAQREEDITVYARYKESIGSVLFDAEMTPDGKVASGTKLYLSTKQFNTSIYYTLDGSQPDPAMSGQTEGVTMFYDDAIVLSDEIADGRIITVRAAAVKRGCVNGPVTTMKYELVDESSNWGEVSGDIAREESIYSAKDIPSGLWVSGVKALVPYTGKAYKFDTLGVYYGKTRLQYKKDYTVKYSNNKNAGIAKITISGKGNYTGKTYKTFGIGALDIGYAMADDILLQYNGKLQNGKTQVRYNIGGKLVTLKAGKDFDYVYPNASGIGNYIVLLKGKGNYFGQLAINQRITDSKLMTKLSYRIKGGAYQGGAPVEPETLSVRDGSYELNMQKINKEELNAGLLATMGNAGYDCVYYIENNRHAGDATITFVGTNHEKDGAKGYEGTVRKTYQVAGIPISSAQIQGLEESYALNKGMADPFRDGRILLYARTGEQLVLGTSDDDPGCNYVVRIVSGGVNKTGTVTVEIIGRNNYSGKIIKTYKIVGEPIDGCQIQLFNHAKIIYSGEPMTLWMDVVMSDGRQLINGLDYTLQYSDNVNAGTAKVKICGIGKFSGELVQEFPIEPCMLNENENILVEDIDEAPYTKNFTDLNVTIKRRRQNGSYDVLKAGRDYKVTCTNNTAVNALATAVIEGIGNYAGTITKGFRVVTGRFSDASGAAKDIVYQRKPELYKNTVISLTDANGVELDQDTDYIIEGYYYANDTPGVEVKQGLGYMTDPAKGRRGSRVEDEDILPAGTEVRVVLGSCSNNYEGSAEAVFRIVSKDISKAKVKVAKQDYMPGKSVEPGKNDIQIGFGGGETLSKTDYEIVGYENNTKKGTGKVILRGKGNYGGTKTVKFKIGARSFTIFGLEISM